ncbi:uncharacterized protein CcaverHIS019_0205220 [Cutaneotrichosporon cavernicola]|uniref:Uncharacterized protein n=1 Tax=Cutaneotrichosporon cavernicola TaxID=279322 RepID=A0AA48I8R5_9TREE|nr:uncharacterized protein CcaverHIS019_0205220 [Cutaneotrichosporon cavernicola]BEI89160.1 hypothetical protein CcaverHIS019_0205220 [Cutaneotrichosporon cavernicola]
MRVLVLGALLPLVLAAKITSSSSSSSSEDESLIMNTGTIPSTSVSVSIMLLPTPLRSRTPSMVPTDTAATSSQVASGSRALPVSMAAAGVAVCAFLLA